MKNITASLLLVVGLLLGSAASGADWLDPGAALRPGLAWQPTAILRSAARSADESAHPLMRSAFFRFIDRLPLEPTSIGQEPRLPYEHEPAMGVMFVMWIR